MTYRTAKKIVTALSYVVMGCPGGRVAWTDSQIRTAYRVYGRRHGQNMTLGGDFIISMRKMFVRMAKSPPQTFIYHNSPVTN